MLPGREARSSGVANLGRRLLSIFTAATFVGFAIVVLREVSGTDPAWLIARGIVLTVLAAAVTAIISRSKWPLGQLRFVEALVFGTVALYLAVRTYALGIVDLEAAAAGWTGTLVAFGLLTIAYGVFVPNGLARAASGIALIGVTPLATALLIRAADPETTALFDALATNRSFETALTLGTSAGVATIAAFVSHSLYDFAFEQRKKTFYDLEERIGSGGMGEVWRARHRTLARPTAVKLIRDDKVEGIGGDEARRVLLRFEREAKATAALRSPHTIDVYDFGVTEDGHFFYAMEYLQGLDLEQLVERFGPVPAERVVHFLLQACDSLSDAHFQGLTHRDIKPANLFLSRLGPSCDYIKLLDFGLVQHKEPVEESAKLTAEGTTSGTPAYMAPETVVGQGDVNGRADIYALGCVAYWLVTGKQVFEAETSVAVIVEHVKTPPTPPSERTELPIPPELETIIMKCLAKDPIDRFQSAREMANALNAVPLARRWDTKRADEWWDLHAPEASAA